jgi:predicted CXXCH cytochrome family protein
MSSSDRLLLKAGPALCGKCHESIVEGATADTGHAAASDDCTSCHDPHRADQPSLLTGSLPDLCLECHDADDADLMTAHLDAEVRSLNCTSCHTPHGDGNPKLLAGTVHAPVLDGCDLCHQSSASDLIEDGESALCLECHDDIGALANEAPVPHDAMELGRCADCHNPHASPQDFLVKASGGGACIECHDDQAAGDDEFAHGVIALLGCRACHEPHGGQNPRLLRQVGATLCLACHDARGRLDNGDQTVRLLDRFDIPVDAAQSMASLKLSADGQRNHPVTGHRVMGVATEEELKRIETTFEGELTCLTCHDPHKGRTQNLLLGDVTSSMSLCLGCHPK